MKFSLASTLVVSLAAQATANSWFGNAVYDKWHETELERWLSDHGIPHPSPSDRKNLQSTVKANWNDKVVTPYTSWDAQTLTNYLTLKGQQATKGTENDAKSLAEQVKVYWTETEDSANQAYGSVKEWIFDSWSDSQLKAFADKQGIPVPQPRQRDSLLKAVRENYQSAADKAKETANYPGDWLYASWSDSDLKSWFDERGYNVPQPSTRDSMIANLRRQSRLASLNAQGAYASVSSAAASAQSSLSDALLDSWSDSQIKEWADTNGIKVPQGSKRNELIALARKHRARLYGDSASATAGSISASGASAYGAATSNVGSQYAAATGGFAYYTDLIKQQIGLVAASATSITDAAYVSASSAASAASVSAASLSGAAGKSASASASSLSQVAASASAAAVKSASSASAAMSSGSSSAYASASSAASVASVSAASLSGAAGKSASASASSLSKAAYSASLAADKSASSASSALSKSAKSGSSSVWLSASSAASVASVSAASLSGAAAKSASSTASSLSKAALSASSIADASAKSASHAAAASASSASAKAEL